MSARFAFNAVTLVAAAFLVVISMAFTPQVAGWTSFGVSTGITVAAVLALMLARTPGDRIGQGAIAAAGLWSLVAALVFSGAVLTWLVFADAVGVAALALAQPTANEVTARQALRSARAEAVTAGKIGLAA
jgi:hypothetical protein